MQHALDLWSWNGRVSRRQYLAAGLALFAAKYPIDLVVSMRFGRPWSPLMYLSPRLSPLFRPGDPLYWVVLLVVALPFIAAGVSLSARRLRDMGWHPFWAGLFFLPFLHFAFFLVLCIAPSEPVAEPAPGGPYRAAAGPRAPPPQLLTRLIPARQSTAFLFGMALSLVLGLGCFVVTVQVHEVLGGTFFVGVPFGMGFLTAFTTCYGGGCTLGRASLYGFGTLTVALLVLVGVGWEGAACIVMAAPIVYGTGWLGVLAGWAAAKTPALQPGAAVCVLLVPSLLGLEIRRPAPPEPLSVVSTVRIDAPPEVVWKNVVSFPPIDSPPDPIFAIVAMPLEARIDGHDPGATRRCVFTNGTFVEPIRVWNEPRELTFGVAAQPTSVEPYIDVTEGQFLLTANPDGSTTLRGTTWYRLRVFPTTYWKMWTETLLHAIHLRVLEHVRSLSEHPGRRLRPAAPLPTWIEQSNATCRCTRHAS